MVASVETMLGKWRQNEAKEIEVYQEFKVLTSEIISRTAFGSSYLEGKNTFDMLARMGSIVSRNTYEVGIRWIRYIFLLCHLLIRRLNFTQFEECSNFCC